MDVKIYEDTINPFDVETAKRFVYAHLNIFAKSVRRRVIHADFELIVVKEITTAPDGEKEVWYWGFTPTKRGIVKNVNDEEAIQLLSEALL